MTTGLQNVRSLPTPAPPAGPATAATTPTTTNGAQPLARPERPAFGRFAAACALLRAPFHRRAARTVASLAPARGAHEIRRGVRLPSPTSARDLHDAAVMRGVFPPRL